MYESLVKSKCKTLFKVVPVAGLEPARREAVDFESTKSTIPSHWHKNKVCDYIYYLLKRF